MFGKIFPNSLSQDNVFGGITEFFEKVLDLVFLPMEKFHESVGSTGLA